MGRASLCVGHMHDQVREQQGEALRALARQSRPGCLGRRADKAQRLLVVRHVPLQN